MIRAQATLSLRQALLFHAFEFFLGALDRLGNHSSVKLNLCLARPASVANTPALSLQMRPTPHQTSAQVLKPGELNLQFAFVGAGALGKNLQNEHGAVIHRQAHVPLQIALLRRTQGLVKQNLLGIGAERKGFDFIGLA